MAGILKSFCVVSFLEISFCVSSQGLANAQYLDSGIKEDGIFVKFLKNTLELLTTVFPERKLSKYCTVVSKELEKMEFTYTKKLAKHFRKLSKMDGEDIKEEMIMYNLRLDEPSTYRTKFLQAMNEALTLRENILLNDYVYDLNDYGNRDKLFIDKETGKVLNDVIVGAILKMSARDQRDLTKTLRKAIREYQKELD